MLSNGELFAALIAQVPIVDQAIEFANKHKDESTAFWTSLIAFGAVALLVFVGRWGFKKIELVISNHEALQAEYIEALKTNLTATQKIASGYESQSSQTANLLKEDIEATKTLAARASEQARALEKVESAIGELIRNVRPGLGRGRRPE
jgi:hypothetical protein